MSIKGQWLHVGIKPSADARVMCHIGPLSRGAAITNKIHHCVIEVVVGLLALQLQSVVIQCYISFSEPHLFTYSHCFLHLPATFTLSTF